MAQASVRTPAVRNMVQRSAAIAQTRVSRIALLALGAAAIAMPGAAWAQCTPTVPAAGGSVTCTGTASSYSTSVNGVAVTVASGASVQAPLSITGSGGSLINIGTISGSGATATVNYGDGANITNTGTITATGAGAAAISVGANSTVTEGGAAGTITGTLTAATGSAAVQFGTNGTYIQTNSTAGVTTGNIVFGTNTGTNKGTFTNNDIVYGLSGSVTATGNVSVTNNGLWTGSFSQLTSTGSTVSFTNGATGNFTGTLFTQDNTTVVNNATGVNATSGANNGMSLFGASSIGTAGAGASFTNNGNLTLGSVSSPTLFTVFGTFNQSATGVLNIAIAPAGSLTNAAGSTYSQLYATGTSGNITLAGTVNLNIAPGFYATGTTYNVVLADGTITTPAGGVALTGATALPFVSFCPTQNANTATGACSSSATISALTVGSQQALQLTALHTVDYAQSLIAANAGANANQLAVARGLNPLIALASAASTGSSSNEAAFLGQVDVLGNSDALNFLTSASPQGYYAYAESLRDQANAFSRAIDLRMQDQNSNHDEDGWWASTQAQFQLHSATGTNTKSRLIAFTGGYDYSGPNHVYGIAANISWNSLSYAPGTMSGSNRDMALAAYSGWNFGPLHLTGQLAYNYGHLSATKTMDFLTTTTTTAATSTTAATTTTSTATSTNKASAGEGLFKATGTAGFQLKSGSFQLEPFVGIDFMRGQVNSFTETSSQYAASALTVNPISADRTDLLAGVSLSRAKGEFRPYLRVMYRERLSGAGSNVTAAFDGLTGASNSFTVTANPTAKGEIDTNAGINWVFDDAGSLFLGYENTLRNGMHSHGINLGIRIEF